jgi:hypothetical protein
MTEFLNIYYSSNSTTETESGRYMSVVDSFEVNYSSVCPLPMAGNVYVTLFLQMPTHQLSDPLYVLRISLWLEGWCCVPFADLVNDQVLRDESVGGVSGSFPPACPHDVSVSGQIEPRRRRDGATRYWAHGHGVICACLRFASTFTGILARGSRILTTDCRIWLRR